MDGLEKNLGSSLIERVAGINLRGDTIEEKDFLAYQDRLKAYVSDCCYGADCGDCDSDGSGYCIDSECE